MGGSSRRSYAQPCPVAGALDVVGERWTLLLVRDLMFGPLRFTELHQGLPGLAPNLLSERLKMLCEEGLVEQVPLPPPASRTAYALTATGRSLGPVIHELSRFGVERWEDPDGDPPPERLLRGAVLSLMDPTRLGSASWTAHLDLDGSTIGLHVHSGTHRRSALERLRLSHPSTVTESDADVRLYATLGTLVELRRGTEQMDAAIAAGRLDLRGRPQAVGALVGLFGWT